MYSLAPHFAMGSRHQEISGLFRRRGACWVNATIAALLLVSPLVAGVQPQRLLLDIADAGTNGLVLSRVDFTAAVRHCGLAPTWPWRLTATRADGGDAIAVQFVPDPDFNPSNHLAGTVVAQLPVPGPRKLLLAFKDAACEAPAGDWDGHISGPDYSIEHDAEHQGGLPWRITFTRTGKGFTGLRWNNRLHHRTQGSFCFCDDPAARVTRVADGPLCAVVRAEGRFVRGERHPESTPTAAYDWYYFKHRPLIFVSATVRQSPAAIWHELHFLEMNYPGAQLPRWAGGEPLAEGQFKSSQQSLPQSAWGMVHDGTNGVAFFQAGQVLIYDGGAGTYLQAHGDSAWQEWSGTQRDFSAWIWVGSDPRPVEAAQNAVQSFAMPAKAVVTVDTLRARLDRERESLRAKEPVQRKAAAWRWHGARQLELAGNYAAAAEVLDGKKPDRWTILEAGDLALILENAGDGVRLQSLFDQLQAQDLSSPAALPLFSLVLRDAVTGAQERITADRGWRQVQVRETKGARAAAASLRWRSPEERRFGNLEVEANVIADPTSEALRWRFVVRGVPAPWSVWRVVFPQLATADFGAQGAVFFPKGAGQVERGPGNRALRFAGTYPSGWTSMQFLAAYDATRGTGIYVAHHDPWGSTKDLLVESRPTEHSVVLGFDHPAPDMGRPGNGFELAAEAVWQLFRGDWYDAAVIYREWVRKEAKWYPPLGENGREDTPPWMRELDLWALSGGSPSNCVPEVRAFADSMGVPTAVHWYNWHEIPFDNDYPHYFPSKPGFASGVKDLQDAGVPVMPYINGRLWDSRDRGTNDFEFSRLAMPAVTKNQEGDPFLEAYGSKEADDTPVKLGVMCPSTAFWGEKVREIVHRLMKEEGVKGVYIDQIAAAAPTLCADPAHGHPLGGGHWWTEGYWQMLEAIRKGMPRDAMLTTECNGEPFIRYFDGYLTWHWQYDGQVPAFPAVYGGTVQMFGRSYGGGPTRDLALRMRVGQQLVFGEQIGWLSPGVLKEPDNAAFLRQAVQLRRKLAAYFYKGEMARPPRLEGGVPAVRADWQWYGTAWVTTEAVLAGAWSQPSARRVVLIFANVSDEPVVAEVRFDARACGFTENEARVTPIEAYRSGPAFATPPSLQRKAVFHPRQCVAWEITAP